jgi:MSHA biogenesis protein MshQ
MRRAVLVLWLAACGLSVDGTGSGNGAPPSSPGADATAPPPDTGAPPGDAGGPESDAAPPQDTGQKPPWAYMRKLTIDNSQQDALVDFPILVVLDPSRIDYGHCQASGADLRFTDNVGALLDYEIEAWKPGDKSYLWIRVPQVPSRASLDIWMVYGNPTATDQQTPPRVWDASFVGVWHLASVKDSTGKHGSTNEGATATTGQVGPAMAFDGTGQYIDTKATEQLDTWTIEAWSYASSSAQSNGQWSGPLMRDNYNLQWDCQASSFCRTTSILLKPADWVEASFGSLISQTWYYLAATFDTHSLVSFVNGLQSDSTDVGTNTAVDVSSSAKIGANRDATAFFGGKVDEVRISNTVRSKSWIAAQQLSMNDRYLKFGAEQPF